MGGIGEIGTTTISNSEGLKLLSDGVKTLVEDLPAFARALEVVSKVHPFLEGIFSTSVLLCLFIPM